MEDDLNLIQINDDLNILANGRQHQKKIMQPKTIKTGCGTAPGNLFRSIMGVKDINCKGLIIRILDNKKTRFEQTFF